MLAMMNSGPTILGRICTQEKFAPARCRRGTGWRAHIRSSSVERVAVRISPGARRGSGSPPPRTSGSGCWPLPRSCDGQAEDHRREGIDQIEEQQQRIVEPGSTAHSQPAMRPSIRPITRAIAIRARRRRRARSGSPARTRLKTSRPRSSVPKIWLKAAPLAVAAIEQDHGRGRHEALRHLDLVRAVGRDRRSEDGAEEDQQHDHDPHQPQGIAAQPAKDGDQESRRFRNRLDGGHGFRNLRGHGDRARQ